MQLSIHHVELSADMGITAENFADASRKAVEDMIEDISGALANR